MAALVSSRRQLERRQDTASASLTTCGFYGGDPDQPLRAPTGQGCNSDTSKLLWNFCPTTRTCGYVGYCVDKHSCTSGCGRTEMMSRTDIGTTTCTNTDMRCGAHILVKGSSSSFEFIGCDFRTEIQTLFPVPLFTRSSTTPSTTPASTTSSTASQTTSFSTATSISSPFPTNTSPLASSTVTPPAETGKSSPTNIGAIVGGTVAGIFLVCATIIGALLIRRRRRNESGHSAKLASPQPNMGMNMGEPEYHAYAQWDSSHGPVEISGNRIPSPTEMPVTERYKQPMEMGAGRHLRSPVEMPATYTK